MTHLYKICLKYIKLFFSTVALKKTQGNDHFEVGVQAGRELQEGKTVKKRIKQENSDVLRILRRREIRWREGKEEEGY
jgi:hypothetical protein